ncbi:MAG: hypothetical protein E7616_02350 [Ruminococcaceae bacterium]|nr:hypothetical protein [Oscillospiraceae bacterium]
MKYVTPELSTNRLILKRGTAADFRVVYEYDFRKLRDICGEFTYIKLDPQMIEEFETYVDEIVLCQKTTFISFTNNKKDMENADFS